MHGFFIDRRLYKKAQDLANPFAYEQYLEQEKKKLEKIQGSRITIVKKLPKVNRDLANKLLMQKAEESEANPEDLNTKKKPKKNKGTGTQVLEDDRFTPLFTNKDFEVNMLSPEYLSLHPQSAKSQTSLIEEHFEPVMEGGEQVSDDDASEASKLSDDEQENIATNEKNLKRVRLYEVKDERHAEAFFKSVSLANEDKLPLGERIAAREKYQTNGRDNNVKFGPGGSREISFAPRNSKRQRIDKPSERRGVQSLGLKPGKSEFYAMKTGAQERGRGRGRGRGNHSR